MRRRSPAPLWFQVAVAAALALAVRALDAWLGSPGVDGGGAPHVQVAFWPLVIFIASTIWKGLEVAGRITLEALKWSVVQLWSFARATYNAAIGVGKELLKGLRRGWDFFEATYEHVLKPAWQTFWKWFQRARRWLEDLFRPVFKFLEFVRTRLLEFYAKYVRPVLDTIDAARRILRVLETLGLDWAKRLDGWLAELQRRIDEPFRLLLAEINKVINVVNRIVTLDGLFQRVALLRSIERDIRYVSRVWWNTAYEPLSKADRDKVTDVTGFPTTNAHAAEFRAILNGTAGARSRAVDEHAADFKLMLRRLRGAA